MDEKFDVDFLSQSFIVLIYLDILNDKFDIFLCSWLERIRIATMRKNNFVNWILSVLFQSFKHSRNVEVRKSKENNLVRNCQVSNVTNLK